VELQIYKMTDTPDLWEVRKLPDRITLELHAGAVPALILVQGDNSIRIDPTRVKALVGGGSQGIHYIARPVPRKGRAFSHLPEKQRLQRNPSEMPSQRQVGTWIIYG
jgi:hypothetical protein